MKKHRRIAILVAQILTLIEAIFLAFWFFLWIAVVLAFGHDLFVIRITFLGVAFCALMIPFAIAGILHAFKTPWGYFKSGSAIVSMVFNGVFILIVVVFLFLGDTFGLPVTVIELISGLFVASEYLLIYGLTLAAKEKRASLSEIPPQRAFQSNDSSPEKAAWTNALCALWKLYEQQLITEEEYLTQRNAIFALSNLK